MSDRLVRFQMDFFVLDAAPGPLDEHVVAPSPVAAHRQPELSAQHGVGERARRELTVLIDVHDAWPPVAGKRNVTSGASTACEASNAVAGRWAKIVRPAQSTSLRGVLRAAMRPAFRHSELLGLFRLTRPARRRYRHDRLDFSARARMMAALGCRAECAPPDCRRAAAARCFPAFVPAAILVCGSFQALTRAVRGRAIPGLCAATPETFMSMHLYRGFEIHPLIYPRLASVDGRAHNYEAGFDAAVRICFPRTDATASASRVFKLDNAQAFDSAGDARRASLRHAEYLIDRHGGERWSSAGGA